ncbi:MAG: TIGR00304 family membrane protein [Thermoplasmatota archaeon]
MDRASALYLAAAAAALIAVAVGAVAIATGDLHLALLLIVPVFYGTGPLAFVAILFVFVAFVLFSAARMAQLGAAMGPRGVSPFSRPESARPEGEGDPGTGSAQPRETTPDRGGAGGPPRSRHAGVVLIGPIPIVWGSDPAGVRRLVISVLLLVLAVIIGYAIFAFVNGARP